MYKEGLVKTTVYIDKSLHEAVKIHAALSGQTISYVVEEALQEYLERNPYHNKR